MALFLRGFKFSDINEQVFSQTLNTPSLKVWLAEVSGYQNKMAAYKAGVAAEQNGLGVYVLNTNNQWQWVAAVYTSYDDAEKAVKRNTTSAELCIREYEIKSKSFKITREAIQPSQEILKSVVEVFMLLIELRNSVLYDLKTEDLILALTTEYNTIKSNTEKLQELNANIKSPLIASIIYTANQNILGLQDIIFGDKTYSLATLNTVLLKTIFSLDNF